MLFYLKKKIVVLVFQKKYEDIYSNNYQVTIMDKQVNLFTGFQYLTLDY